MRNLPSLLILVLLVFVHTASAEGIRELSWEDLIPPGTPDPLLADDLLNIKGIVRDETAPSGISYDPAYFPVNEALDGLQVAIPGYVVPLVFDQTEVEEFMLVPFVGACIHVPPPPPNQIVYVKTPDAIEVEGLFAPVWVIGRMSLESKSSELAFAGYSMVAESIEPYDDW